MCKIKNGVMVALALLFMGSAAALADVNEELINKVAFGRAADVEILLKQKADPNSINSAGLAAIFLAAGRADEEAPKITKLLIDAGADINISDSRGNMPIVEAVKRGHPLSVKLLIENNAVMAVKDSRGNDLPKMALIRGDRQVIAYVDQGVAAENKKLAGLKSSDSLTKMVQKYSYLSCANFYLKYYKHDNPEKLPDDQFAALIKRNEDDSKALAERLNSLFDLKRSDFSYIESQTRRLIRDKLDSLINNENRLYNGFGTNSDLNYKCKPIAQSWDGSRFTYVEKPGGLKVITGYK